MRRVVLRHAVLAGAALTLAACADTPTQSDQQGSPGVAGRRGPLQDGNSVQCTDGAVCLDPIVVIGDPGDGDGGGWSGGGGDDDGGSDPDGRECMASAGVEPVVQGCTGGGSEPEEEEESDICPEPLRGRTLTTLVNVAGQNHEFQFTGTMRRINPLVGRSPAWYKISGPTVSKDSWWIAESGSIQLVCWGRWHLRNSVWLGTVVVQATDLHMVMGPGHPDF